MKITCISDTHGLHNRMRHVTGEGDVLIHSGDLTNIGEKDQVEDIIAWFHRKLYNFNHVVFIAGNHDRSFDPCFVGNTKVYEPRDVRLTDLQKPEWLTSLLDSMDSRIHYLENSSVTIDGKKIFGSPMTPNFYEQYWAFNRARGYEINEYWCEIPDDTNILITHGPYHGTFDYVAQDNLYVGCEDLGARVKNELNDLELFVCGHIHQGYGVTTHQNSYRTFTSVNASICTEEYKPINEPIIVEL